MLLNLSALYDILFLRGVLIFGDNVGWDAPAMGEMYISRLATLIGRFFWREIGLKPLRVVGVVELDVKE